MPRPVRTLADLADITIGYQHRPDGPSDEISARSKGSHRIIQIKDLDRDGEPNQEAQGSATAHKLWIDELYRVTPHSDPAPYAVQEGDVLFLSRGNHNFAIPLVSPYVEPLPKSWSNMIAAYQFYRLRLRGSNVLPEYLAWWFGSDLGQAQMHGGQEGTHMKMFKRRDFEKLPINVPPLETQRRIISLHHLALQEQELMESIRQKRRALVESMCSQLASGQIQ